METLQSVFDLPDVSFIENDTLTAMVERMIANYESEYLRITGRPMTLAPADPLRILIYAFAMDLYQVEQYVDRAGKQDLLKYSYGEFLDNLAANRSVTRRPASPARTTLRFTLSETKAYAVSIPMGTQATNGEGVFFETEEYGEVAIGDTYVDIPAVCTVDGIAGNDMIPGQVSVMVDAIPYVESVANTTTSEGGADLESDASLAERVYLAPSSYSVAGPADAYVFWTKTYNAEIGSVKPTNPDPCEVEIYILMEDGTLPGPEIISGLTDYLMDENIRPLTDHVTVKAPTVSSFNVALTYYINRSDAGSAVTIQEAVTAAVDDYIKWQTTEIGKDINPSELIKRVVAAGAKRVTVSSPVFTAVPETAVAHLGTKAVTYGGLEDD